METIVEIIKDALGTRSETDPINQCGEAVLDILQSRPSDVLDLAYQKLNTWPFAVVPVCWRRAYEDASLARALNIVQEAKRHAGDEKHAVKRRRMSKDNVLCSTVISDVVDVLDNGLNISGAPLRASVFASIFKLLREIVEDADENDTDDASFRILRPTAMGTERQVARSALPMSLADFQSHMDSAKTPIVISRSFDHWPARDRWTSPSYLKSLTLGGRRRVPVELGRSYTDDSWGQRFMPFSEFLDTYILSDQSEQVGYLAQHDLFAQIPELRDDIAIPDYCYTTPPAAQAGCTTEPLDEPLLNAWFGPKSTTTPLHTDPYHNILCQVVGYKYVRLYAPNQTVNLYPSGVDEKGINMDNTSQVDVSYFARGALSPVQIEAVDREHPNFRSATYSEALLEPGDCLYIPAGWWHYVESLSVSFSVSFWWN